MNSRRILISASAVLVLAACSSSTSGTPTTTGAAAGTSSGSSSSTNPPVNTPAALAQTLRRGIATIRSAHITLQITTAGQSITGHGDETVDAGRLRALDLTETLPGVGTLRLIQLAGKTYAELPASLNTSGKPWVLVSTSSSNATIRSLAQSLQSAQSSALDSATVFVSAAQSVTDRGPTTVAGVAARHYSVVVDVTKLPSTYSGRSALIAAGIRTLPIELYLDSAGRPVQVTEQVTVSGKQVSTTAGVTNYNQPVTITAPPAGQISSR